MATVNGTTGNDKFVPQQGQQNMTYNGLAGVDTLFIDSNTNQSMYTVTQVGSTIHVDSISPASGYHFVLSGVEKLQFQSGNVTIDLTAKFPTAFTPADTTAPTVSSITPTDNAIDVALTSDIVVKFSETVKLGTGNILLKDSLGNVVETYNAAAPGTNLTISGTTLTVNPSADLSNLTSYTLQFAAGTIKDTAGNNYAGATYHFKTIADTTAPTVTAFSPLDEAGSVLINANVVVTFSEAIAKGTGNIVLKDSLGNVIETYDAASSANLNVSGNVLTINPTADLNYATGYKVEFAAGTIKDLAGNNYAGTTTYNFTTMATPDVTAPTVSGFLPADAASGVAVASDIVVTFNEHIARGVGNILIKDSTGATVETYNAANSGNLTISGNTLTINPTANLVAGIQYTVEIPSGSIADLSGNPYAGENTYTFTTVAGTQTGTAAANTINGTAGMDLISGLAGNDKLNGLAGADTLDGGVGNDILNGGDGNDSLIGGAGADKLSGLAGNETMDGGVGNDILDGGAGADEMQGGAGNDVFIVDDLGDIVSDTSGVDAVKSSVSFTLTDGLENLTLTGTDNITATGNAANNILTGNAGNNSIAGGAGNDALTGGLGNDTLDGGDGVDKLVGGKGDDTFIVNLKTATIKGVVVASLQDAVVEVAGAANGNDTLELSGGTVALTKASTIALAATLENLDATATVDTLLNLNGNAANNAITGNAANNAIKGLAGIDHLDGAAGADTLFGGTGNDALTGGTGADIFVFDSKLNSLSNVDTISDFEAGVDKLQLSKLIFTMLKGDIDLSDNLHIVGGVAQDANDYLTYDSTSGALSYDADGSGTKAAVQFAVLGTGTHPADILATDMFVI